MKPSIRDTSSATSANAGRALAGTSRRLARALEALTFAAPVAYVYNPLIYARKPHEAYLLAHAAQRPDALLVGMNPGPWGMAQTGVPFGEVELVRDWLGIEEPVESPPREHPKRRVAGFACPRSEVSGRRLWGWAKSRFGTPERFFRRFFVINYCPLMFLDASGRNLTPDKLPADAAGPMLDLCDRALREAVNALRPRHVVGVGTFAETRARKALADLDVHVGRMPHPSPASPAANRGWEALADAALENLGLLKRPGRGVAAPSSR
ncbi:MAG: hypothetical protein FLDDKLPJ_00569 [Phycisphaerae bacterium]|nr:hypothetical protein [Phycisphaerae bacterium]